MDIIRDLIELERAHGSIYPPKLETEEVQAYYQAIRDGSLPEHAFYRLFEKLCKELFGEEGLQLQVRSRGVIPDYVKEEGSYRVAIEVKSPFTRRGRTKLQVERHLEQVKSYLEVGYDYVILTDGYDWFFFSRSSLIAEKLIPFAILSLDELYEERKAGIVKTCRALERDYPLKDLDKYFFKDLKEYVREFEDILESQEKAVKLINSLVFLRTLEEVNVVDYKRLENRLKIWEADHGKETKKVFDLLLDDVKEFYYDYFDTDLFKWEEILSGIPEDKKVEFLRTFKRVMGYDRYTSAFYKGLKYYNFELIDEDVFGKSYETFLAERRKEEGIFYTPKYITNYLVRSCLDLVFQPLKEELRSSIRENNLEKACQVAQKIKEVRILDPACGSGSFLVKVVRYLFELYDELLEDLKEVKHSLFEDTNKLLKKVREILELGSSFDSNLAKTIVSRHVFGIDLDPSALSVARTNIWKEMLKLKPDLYKLDKVRNRQDHQLFPSLEENLIQEDALFYQSDKTFTVIVGNPPYIRHERIEKNYKEALQKRYPVAESTWDIYAYFMVRGYELLEEGGVLGFIVSNKWLRAKYGESLREFLSKNVKIIEIKDFTGIKVFEDAQVDVMTIIFKKEKPVGTYQFYCSKEKENRRITIPSNRIGKEWILEDDKTYELKKKIESVGKPLSEWDVRIYRGILTGFNNAFIIDTIEKEKILKNCKTEEEKERTEEIIKRVLRGEDIKRYYYKWDGEWIILTYRGISISNCILQHLEKFKDQLEKRAGSQRWYELQAPPSKEKVKLLTLDKIGYSDIGLRFAYVDKDYVGLNTTYFIIPPEGVENRREVLLYLLGVLNSKLISFYYTKSAQKLSEDATRSFSIYIENLPIPPFDQNQPIVKQIEELVDKILSIKKQNPEENTSKEEREIDLLVCELYGLTEEERKIVGVD